MSAYFAASILRYPIYSVGIRKDKRHQMHPEGTAV